MLPLLTFCEAAGKIDCFVCQAQAGFCGGVDSGSNPCKAGAIATGHFLGSERESLPENRAAWHQRFQLDIGKIGKASPVRVCPYPKIVLACGMQPLGSIEPLHV